MNNKKRTGLSILGMLFFFCIGGISFAESAVSAKPGLKKTWGDLIIESKTESGCFPVLSENYPNAGIKEAYAVQFYMVGRFLNGKQPPGFKAGLTSPGAQKRFGVSEPVSGVLFPYTVRNGTVRLALFKRPMIETEIGLVIGKAITCRLKDRSELLQHIKWIMPVIELPDLCFTEMKKLRSLDIIAANVSVAGYITGKRIPVGKLDINGINVTLSANGKPVNRGKGTDAMGDQWKAALWLINGLTDKGWEIKPGQFIITGALGKMIPAKPGRYKADFGMLGEITFALE